MMKTYEEEGTEAAYGHSATRRRLNLEDQTLDGVIGDDVDAE